MVVVVAEQPEVTQEEKLVVDNDNVSNTVDVETSQAGAMQAVNQ